MAYLDAKYIIPWNITIVDIYNATGILRKTFDFTVERMGKSKNDD